MEADLRKVVVDAISDCCRNININIDGHVMTVNADCREYCIGSAIDRLLSKLGYCTVMIDKVSSSISIAVHFKVYSDEYYIDLLRTYEKSYVDEIPGNAVEIPLIRYYGYGKLERIGKIYVIDVDDMFITYRELGPKLYAVAKITRENKLVWNWLVGKLAAIQDTKVQR